MAASLTNSWDDPFPVFSYSESQDQRRRRCARAHYYGVYGAHLGWCAEERTASWIAYRLKKATPLSAAVGTEIHTAASACVRSLLAGEKMPSFDVLRARAGATLNTLWKNSRTRQDAFLKSPSRAPLYLESLYGGGPGRSQLYRAAQTLDRALYTLVQNMELWDWVRSADPKDVILMDPFTSMRLSDEHGPITCYGAADLIVRPDTDSPWHIIDFKTGSADGVVDQILTYSVIAQSVLGLDFARGCRGVVVSLGEHADDALSTFAVEPYELTESLTRIYGAVASSRALLSDPRTNEPLPIDAFPKTANPRNCSWCSFRGLCDPDAAPLVEGISAVSQLVA